MTSKWTVSCCIAGPLVSPRCGFAHLASCTYRTCGTSNFLTVNRLASFWNPRSEVSVSNYKRSAAALT